MEVVRFQVYSQKTHWNATTQNVRDYLFVLYE